MKDRITQLEKENQVLRELVKQYESLRGNFAAHLGAMLASYDHGAAVLQETKQTFRALAEPIRKQIVHTYLGDSEFPVVTVFGKEDI